MSDIKTITIKANAGEEIIGTYVGNHFMDSAPVYRLMDLDVFVVNMNSNSENPELFWLSPLNDADGEPSSPVKMKIKLVDPERKEPTREERKLIIARMIHANEFKIGKTSVEWLDLASGIHNLDLTKELLNELMTTPYKMEFKQGEGWVLIK